MNKIIRKRILITSLVLIFTISFISVHQVIGWDSTQTWTSQATGCTPVGGNVDQPLTDIYLGVGPQVPTSIIQLGATDKAASYLEGFKTNIVGMSVNQFKSFVLPNGYGANAPDPALDYKDLFFEVTLTEIINDPGTNVTTRDSLVNVIYSLYIDCQAPVTGSAGTTITTSSKVAPPDNTNLYFFGGLAGIIVIGVASYLVINGRKTNLNTDKILTKTKQKETQSIQSLKESLGTKSY